MNAEPEISVVVPIYNEEQNIEPFLGRIVPVLERHAAGYEIIFALDPGKDRTESILRAKAAQDARIKVLIMTRRWGQPAAIMAGLDYAKGKACVIIDVDLQDPPEVIAELVAKWREGYQVVSAQRQSRQGETLSKRIVAWVGYWLIGRISEVPISRNTGDFRLMDRCVVNALKNLKETHGFLRGLVGYVGYRQVTVPYNREARLAGQSKYSQFTGSLRIGLNGIVAFSGKPLTVATIMGFIAAGFSMMCGLIYVVRSIVLHQTMMAGMAPIILMLTFLGGVQLVCLGIVGEYIGRIYEEVRQRPKYLVAEFINGESQKPK